MRLTWLILLLETVPCVARSHRGSVSPLDSTHVRIWCIAASAGMDHHDLPILLFAGSFHLIHLTSHG